MRKRKSHYHKTIDSVLSIILAVFFTISCIAITGTILLISVLVFAMGKTSEQRQANREAYLNSLIAPELVENLCSHDALPEQYCNGTTDLRYRDMKEIVQTYPDKNLTYDDVFALFGEYESTCNLPWQLPPDTYACGYALPPNFLSIYFLFDESTDMLLQAKE